MQNIFTKNDGFQKENKLQRFKNKINVLKHINFDNALNFKTHKRD